MAEGTQRRLAAIVSADVVGYSRLIGQDEKGTLAALRAHRAELIDPLIAEHGGRVVKTTGADLQHLETLMETRYRHLRIEKVGKVAHLILQRPDILNAVDQAAVVEVEAASRALAADPELRLIAIRGAGRAFCTGIDLKALAADGIEFSYFRLWEDAMRRFETMDKLVLCLIHGYAIGGGLQLALACDIRVTTADAQLSVPAINEGLLPGLGTFRLARYIGHGRAKQMILSGDAVTGAEALTLGLVDHLVPADDMEAAFEALIEKYMAANSEGSRLAKLAVGRCFDLGYEAFLDHYMPLQEQAFGSQDFKEAMTAYRANRKPNWR